MEAVGPKIESTGDVLRIEFPGPRKWRIVIAPLVFALVVLGWWAIEYRLNPAHVPERRIFVSFFSIWFTFNFSSSNRRYTVTLSEKELTIKQDLLGLRWTKRYPLTEIQNLHLRYNPIAGKPPKQWELTFDWHALAQNVPIAMTLPDAQKLKETIYSRFPQLAPGRPFFWQV